MLIAGMQAWTVNHALMMRLPNTFSRRFCPSVITIAFAAFLFSACATRKADAVLDRTVAPEVRADVPATASESGN
jgi:cation transport ATPase